MTRPARIADCHPEARHYALGKCKRCYTRTRYRPVSRVMSACHPDRPHYGHGQCKNCYTRQWNREHPGRAAEIVRAGYARDRERILGKVREKAYGVTPEQYRADVIGQAGRCLVCLMVPAKDLVVDHDHATGRYRGLLCGRCNSALGYLADSPDRVRAAAGYLERSR